MSWSDAWSTQQLVEFTAVLPGCAGPTQLFRRAVERAAEAVDADVAALVRDGRVLATVGFRSDDGGGPQAVLTALGSGAMLVPGVGVCPVLSVPVGGEVAGHLLLARAGGAFTVQETSLVRGMGRVLSLAISQLELVGELRSRQQLLEQLGTVQRALARRAPLREVLDAITSGARDLLDADLVALRLLDPEDPQSTELVSSQGLSDVRQHRARRLPVTMGLAGRAMTTGTLVVVTDYQQVDLPAAGVLEELRAAMAAPVWEDNRIVGALMVASARPERTYSVHDRQTLSSFADHVSLALTDAHTMAAVQQARHDPLTGLANRGLFLDRVARELASAGSRRPTAVLFVDLDRFKTVNDTLGHAAGDELLVTVASRIRAALREDDVTGRLGGDEFAVLLPGTDSCRAREIADRVLTALTLPVVLGERRVAVGASIGLASTADLPTNAGALPSTGTGGSAGTRPHPVGGETQAAELLRQADLAMYRAKDRNGSCVQAFAPAMSAEVLRTGQLRQDLQHALAGRQLWLALQPVVDLRNDATVGAEALLRWTHPTSGPVPPLEFVPVAEQAGLLIPIGRWVLHEACAQAAAWPTPPGGLPLTIAVNLSVCQLADPHLVDDVVAALSDTGLAPARLTLEITESLLVHDVAVVTQQLLRLKELGVRLAIDDFGTGCSSLAHLAQLPVDILKIDRSFVVAMSGSPQATALTGAVVRLAESMHLVVVSEGIETSEQLQDVRDVHCHYGQGYALGLPVHADLLTTRTTTGPSAAGRSGHVPKVLP